MGTFSKLFGKKKTPAPIEKTPEEWAQGLLEIKDYQGLASIFNSVNYENSFKKFKKSEIAFLLLLKAKSEAVEGLLAELSSDGVGRHEIAKLLVSIGDPKSVPALKKGLDRGDFAGYDDSKIRRFVDQYPEKHGTVENNTCALCGKIRPVSELEWYREDEQRKWFCIDECWAQRGKVLKSGIGTDCPLYSAGMCKAGNGDNLCSLMKGNYKHDCHVYAMLN